MGEVTGGPAIDPAALQAVVEMIGADEPAVIVDLIDTFLMDSAKQVEVMRQPLAAGDIRTLHRAAHSMKSSSATFGAMQLSRLCFDLEQSARADCANGLCASEVELIAAEHRRVVTALEQERVSYAARV